jgi:4-diphosphocytidyl-2-C-methyl-D-erythritol kinase
MEVTWHPAPGKLNLFLHVLDRREEGEHAGYHELQTVFRLIDRADRVGVAVRDDGKLAFEGPFGDQNLCLKAARLLQAETAAKQGAELRLEKHLPVGGGLGGGSSDAATVLLALNRLWRTGLNREQLMKVGLKVGADVPFFVFGSNAVGEGIGERLRALALGPAWYLVLVPQVSVSTKETYDSALTGRSKQMKIPPFFPGLGRNDLEAAVVARYPEVAAQLAWLRLRSP